MHEPSATMRNPLGNSPYVVCLFLPILLLLLPTPIHTQCSSYQTISSTGSSSSSWRLASPTITRRSHTATALRDGSVVIYGGIELPGARRQVSFGGFHGWYFKLPLCLPPSAVPSLI